MPAIFRLLQEKGGLEEKMMYNTYNMGIGMVLAVEESQAEQVMEAVRRPGKVHTG